MVAIRGRITQLCYGIMYSVGGVQDFAGVAVSDGNYFSSYVGSVRICYAVN